jgi:hypothetical protein
MQRKVPATRRLARHFVAPHDTTIRSEGYDREAYFRAEWETGKERRIPRTSKRPSNLSGLSTIHMSEMLRDIRRRARESGLPVVPVVLENHSKDVGDFEPIALFARAVAKADDLEVITLAELARNLERGMYHVRTA